MTTSAPTTTTTRTAIDPRTLLSTLWIVMLGEFLYCDVLGLNDPSHLQSLLDGQFGGAPFTPIALVAAGLLMQIPIAMIVLSRVLPLRGARWASLVAAPVMILVQVGSLFIGVNAPVYLFFSVIEIALLGLIFVIAVRSTRIV